MIFSACTPQEGASLGSSASSSSTGNGTTTPTFQEPTFPLSGIFIQDGNIQTLTSLSLPLNYADSFMVRGKELSIFLRKLPNTTKFCMVGKYRFSGADKFLLLSAKPQSYTDLIKKTSEFYLLVEPSNDVSNQTDCLVTNLINTLFVGATTPSAHFSLNQICATCNTSALSNGLKMFFVNGEEVPQLNFNLLTLNITSSSTLSGNTCTESAGCQARGFNCCLQSQCVNDGGLRPGAITDPAFEVARIDVASNPDRFILYPQFYFICDSRPGNPETPVIVTPTDPDYEAQVRLLELKQLYECLNKIDGEFSYCTQKFTNVTASIPATFSPASKDDVNFRTMNTNFATGDYINNIVKIIYGGQTLYELNKTPLTGAVFVPGTANDIISGSPQSVTISHILPTSAKDGNLYLTYKVDGTCEKVGTSLARCTKSFLQGSSDLFSTFFHNTGKVFSLPAYADLSSGASVIIKISGVVVAEDSTTWTRNNSSKQITFAAGFTIHANQTIEISYFINNSTDVTNLTASKVVAQAAVNAICTCGTLNCNLTPVTDLVSGAVVNFDCVYPTPATEDPAANRTVFVSNKNIAHRYYDSNGLTYDENQGAAPAQEPTELEFKYTNSDVLKPNNLTSFIGFNEIYGSFSKSGTQIAKPAKFVKVKKDKIYDLFTNSGVFSSCLTCGTDFYTSLQKIFPQNFSGKGGGYSPDNFESSRLANASIYRAEDQLFGRACFLPATMIPWTHDGSLTDVSAQRRRRLSGQHFLFANGYNRDWFGFDYGSLIGSFDGVTWFSVGNQRRIKATTGKLYLAINAYFGDLNIDSNFNVTVSETSLFSSDIPDHDTESDGAECQKSHFCSNDNDCFKQLGFDYSCQNVSGLTTSWPVTDANANEVIGSAPRTLLSLISGSNGQPKRCIYRGRGAPCQTNLSNTSNFNGTTVPGTLACSFNNFCYSINSGSANKFNNRITRFANTPRAQNIAAVTTVDTDLVGFGARVIGRPFDYYGSKTVPAAALAGLTSTNANVSAICIPGKDLTNSVNTFELNSRIPSVVTDTSDRVLGVGTTLAATSLKALAACPVVDSTTGNILQHSSLIISNIPATMNSTLLQQSITQNISSNILNLTGLTGLNVFNVVGATPITAVGYQPNTCLKTAGSACLSDMECGPSSFVSSKAVAADLFATDQINEAEEKFLEEGLICGNPDFKFVSAGVKNTLFDVKKNRCCRQTGLDFTVFTAQDGASPHWCSGPTGEGSDIKVAGINTGYTDLNRYSRVHQAYDKMTCTVGQISSTKTFALAIFGPATTKYDQIENQFKTLDTTNKRMCCTENWVRNFHATANGGGHAFAATKLQNIDLEMFKNISWDADVGHGAGTDPDTTFFCALDHIADASCEIKTLTPAEEEKYLRWAASLELIGIPQVAIMTNDQIFKNVDDSQLDQVNTVLDKIPLNKTTKRVLPNPSTATTPTPGEVAADFNDGTFNYFSAANPNAFQPEIKKVFSENEFSCCIPTNTEVPSTTTAAQCCTGFFANLGGPPRCCLNNFTDVTLYLNRYVSSEGGGLPDSAYDPVTGYIKDPGIVSLLAAQKNICCSGQFATGLAINQHSIPLDGIGFGVQNDNTDSNRRFTYMTTGPIDDHSATGNALSKFNAGVRWNNHVYCVPTGFND